MNNNSIICAKNVTYERTVTDRPYPNDNIAVIGSSGRGKSSGFVAPNMLFGGDGSMIISDPKGGLYDQYRDLLIKEGYRVYLFDLFNTKRSDSYNMFTYLRDEADVMSLARTIMYQKEDLLCNADPFWRDSGCSIVVAAIEYMLITKPRRQWTISTLSDILSTWNEACNSASSKMHVMSDVEAAAAKRPASSILRRYKQYAGVAEKTKSCITATVYSKIQALDTPDINSLLCGDGRKTIRLQSISERKTAVFVCVPDTDRSRDVLASIFFTQCMQILCSQADHRPDRKVKYNCRFFLDDFASTVQIPDFDSYTSTIRSRGISVAIMMQSISQLEAIYGKNANTILDNCDTQIFMGSNSVDSAAYFSKRTGMSTQKILAMPYGKCLIIRAGEPHPIIADILKPNDLLTKSREQALQRGA